MSSFYFSLFVILSLGAACLASPLPALVYSQVAGIPFGSTSYQQQFDTAFGAGNWELLPIETTLIGTILDPARTVIRLEGSGSGALAISNWFLLNRVAIENWVAGGGSFFYNSAPNSAIGGTSIPMGFGGHTLTWSNIERYSGAKVAALWSPIAANVVLSFGNALGRNVAHGYVQGPGASILTISPNTLLWTPNTNRGYQDRVGLKVTSWGNGYALFGSLTPSEDWVPASDAFQLQVNILLFMQIPISGCRYSILIIDLEDPLPEYTSITMLKNNTINSPNAVQVVDWRDPQIPLILPSFDVVTFSWSSSVSSPVYYYSSLFTALRDFILNGGLFLQFGERDDYVEYILYYVFGPGQYLIDDQYWWSVYNVPETGYPNPYTYYPNLLPYLPSYLRWYYWNYEFTGYNTISSPYIPYGVTSGNCISSDPISEECLVIVYPFGLGTVLAVSWSGFHYWDQFYGDDSYVRNSGYQGVYRDRYFDWTNTLIGGMNKILCPSPSASPVPSVSASQSPTPTRTQTSSTTATRTPSVSISSTSSPTPSITITRSATSSQSLSLSSTRSPTRTPSDTASPTRSESSTQSPSPSESITPSVSPSVTPFPSVIQPSPPPSPNSSPSSTRTPNPTTTPSLSSIPSPPAPSRSPVVVIIPPNDGGGNNNNTVNLLGPNGTVIGGVIFPDGIIDVGGVLVVNVNEDPVLSNDRAVLSPVVEVNLLDADGNEITSLGQSVEICITADSSVDKNDVCLGYWDTSTRPNKWVCEDKCLSEEDGEYCGDTDHLTNFALLLDSGAGDSSECGSDDTDHLYSWLTLGFCAGAICIVLLAFIAIEINLKRKKLAKDAETSRYSRMISAMSEESKST